MAKKPKPLSRKGDERAEHLYVALGSALSWWETTEEFLTMVFDALCGKSEPVARQTFLIAPRLARHEMIKSAAAAYPHMITPEESARLSAALKKLDKLATVRNELAHGYVSHMRFSHNGEELADGYYLLPSKQESVFASYEPHYHHTSATILEWIEELRPQRGEIAAVGKLVQERVNARHTETSHSYLLEQTARMIATGQVRGEQAFAALRQLLAEHDATSGRLGPTSPMLKDRP